MESDIYRMILSRDKKHTNFVEVPHARPASFFFVTLAIGAPILNHFLTHFLRCYLQFQSFKIIYRRYAGLYFIFGVDVADNELLQMETIHLFVELLDQYFSNVCELDIVFHFNKVSHLSHDFPVIDSTLQ